MQPSVIETISFSCKEFNICQGEICVGYIEDLGHGFQNFKAYQCVISTFGVLQCT